jgi:hypothetical protein
LLLHSASPNLTLNPDAAFTGRIVISYRAAPVSFAVRRPA